jgi:hypothetical protein
VRGLECYVRPAAKFLVTLILASLAAGCGYIGDVRPPLLNIPARIMNLRAAEYGDKIAIAFTLPLLTTDGQSLTGIRSIELRVGANPDRIFQIPPKDSGPIAFDTPAADFVGKTVMLAVRSTGPKGKASEWSSVWTLEVQSPLSTPQAVSAANVLKGIRLTWNGGGPRYRIFRASGVGSPARIGESETLAYDDAVAEIGTEYRYYVQAIHDDSHQSEVSAPFSFTPQDVFPPAVPEGLAGIPGVGAIELVWQRNIEDDFAGYNIFRALGNGEFQRVAGPLDAPTYSDRDIEAGKTYRYSVSSVDRTGNESARTAPVEIVAP